MSIASGGGNELETAVMQAESSSGVEDENIVTLEASEDRLLHWVALDQDGGDILSEVSFSSSFELNNAAANTGDETASGVLIATRGNNSAPNVSYVDYTSAPPQWDAGEEVNLHTNNFSAGARQTRVIIAYEPIGEFRRDRLRNR